MKTKNILLFVLLVLLAGLSSCKKDHDIPTGEVFNVNGGGGSTTDSLTIIVSANPSESGSVTGGGIYHYGQTCTLTANANSGYIFTNWTEDGSQASTSVNYTFTVTGNRTLVANFTETTNADFIVFADAAVKTVCVEHWDTNDDGELSYAEAAAVTVLDDAFKGNSEISTFDELRYFVGLTYISYGDFHGSSIASLTVPENITQIRNQAFYGCQQLSSINIPEGVTSLGYGVFQYCRALPEITLPSSLVELGPVVFLNCYSLRSVTLFSETPPNLDGSAFDEVDKTLITVYVPCGSLEAYQNAEGWNEFTNFVEMCDAVPTGAINGKFTINANGDQVYFSKGNLQYIGSASTPYWKFADNQWDYLGTTTNQNSTNQNVDRDLFGWGTSGYNHGAGCYQPWSTSPFSVDYYAYGPSTYNLYDQTGQADWGYNAISNGGNTTNTWRTLTGGGNGEWKYIFDSRSTPSGIRYAKARVNGVNGVILMPDDWSASYYSLSSTNQYDASFSSNVISASAWTSSLEQHGAVFLPAAGYRDGTSVYNVGSRGGYWSASYYNGYDACYVYYYGSSLNPQDDDVRYYGHSVRLVRSAQ